MKRDKIRSTLEVALKGFTVGSSMLIPGVSGGTMAIILGIYDRLMDAVSNFYYHKKDSFFLLLKFCIGAFAGIFLLAKPLQFLTQAYPRPLLYFFMGAVVGSVPMLCQKAQVTKLSWKVFVYPLLGIGIVFSLALLPANLFAAPDTHSLSMILLLLLAGFVAAIALVLPGISVSYMLLLMGIYEKTMLAISKIDISFLWPLAIGMIVGICATTKLLDICLKRYTKVTYLIILGFVLGSVLQVFPGFPIKWEWVLCPILFVIGFILIKQLSKYDN